MVFSFDEEKVKKECYKLVGISNLGEKSLKGYMKNPKFNKTNNQKEFTITEIAFLQHIAWRLEVDREQTKKFLDCLFKGVPFQEKTAFNPEPLCTAKEMEGISISVFEFYDFCVELHKDIPYLKRLLDEEILDIFYRFTVLWENDNWIEHIQNGYFTIAVSSWFISKRRRSFAGDKPYADVLTLHQAPAIYKQVMLLGEVLKGSAYVEKLWQLWNNVVVGFMKQYLAA